MNKTKFYAFMIGNEHSVDPKMFESTEYDDLNMVKKEIDKYGTYDFVLNESGAFIYGNEETFKVQSQYKIKKQLLAHKIEKALWREYYKTKKDFTVTMKESNNVIKIRRMHRSAHYSFGGWQSSSTWFEVIESNDKRYFKSMFAIAKSMAYGFIK